MQNMYLIQNGTFCFKKIYVTSNMNKKELTDNNLEGIFEMFAIFTKYSFQLHDKYVQQSTEMDIFEKKKQVYTNTHMNIHVCHKNLEMC